MQTFVKHTKRVNTVRWLSLSHFISGSDDGLALFWSIETLTSPQCCYMRGHTSGVNAVDGLQSADSKGKWLLATAAADSTIRLWSIGASNDSEAECIQIIPIKDNGFCFCLRMFEMPISNHVILSWGADDDSVAVWAKSNLSATFSHLHSLKGHEDWVRGMDVIMEGNDILLATSSQDNFIRLWRMSPRTKEQFEKTTDILKMLDSSLADLKVDETILKIDNDMYAISIESVLCGHEGWVYGVQWHKSEEHGKYFLCIL